jgi:PadR family transcriptional regulator PadR
MQHAEIVRPRPLVMAHVLLLLAERPRHGYELAESLRALAFETVTTSSVYRELARLEEDGLVVSFWESSQARGPARHMYELTAAGRSDLARCADDVRLLIDHLGDFLSRCKSLSTPAVASAAPPEGPTHPAGASGPGGARRRPASGLAKLFKTH